MAQTQQDPAGHSWPWPEASAEDRLAVTRIQEEGVRVLLAQAREDCDALEATRLRAYAAGHGWPFVR